MSHDNGLILMDLNRKSDPLKAETSVDGPAEETDNDIQRLLNSGDKFRLLNSGDKFRD